MKRIDKKGKKPAGKMIRVPVAPPGVRHQSSKDYDRKKAKAVTKVQIEEQAENGTEER